MRHTKVLKLGLISITVIAMLCACKGNVPMNDVLDNSKTIDMMDTLEEQTSNQTTIKESQEIAEEETTKEETKKETTTKETTVDDTTVPTTTKKQQSTTEQKTTAKPTATKKPEGQTTTKKQQSTTKKQQSTTEQKTTQKMTTTQQTTEQQTTQPPTTQPQKMAYIVTVRTQGGMELSGIAVNVYADNTHKVLKDCGTTDDFGMVEFTFDKSNKYSITLGDVPAGYNVSNAYSFNGTNADITLSSSVIKGEMPYSLKEGDVMYDITVEAPDGSTYTISEILKNKDAVMLNFWFATCSWCIKEFPYINEAYAQYKDDIEILAVNPFDSMSDIAYVKNNYGLTFPMVSCDYSLSSTFGVTGYPTTIIIDKYGVIRMVESGARTYLDYWTWLFDQYTN